MKKVILNKLLKLTSVFALLFLVFAFEGDTPCDAKVLKEKAKKQLEPYTYDMSKLTHITYKTKPWLKEIEVPLFIGEKYRLVFNTELLPKPIVINIYNRDKDSKKRKLLFTTKDAPADKKEFAFDLTMARKAFIDYEMPVGDSTADGGCLIFMMGYK
ncbi:MAG TPA: hypothetical protein VKG26_15735 [Bacteroidia bacterium]|nr:hypothetical protein [Bacteroidia bacterium]